MSVKLFCGSSYRDLGERIARHLDMPLGEITLDNFADGEVNIFIGESVRNCECVIIQSTSQCENKSVNDILLYFSRLLIFISVYQLNFILMSSYEVFYSELLVIGNYLYFFDRNTYDE